MSFEKKPFIPYRLDEDKSKDKSKVVPVRLNIEELKRLEETSRFLNQEKLSTTLKQLSEIGYFVIQEQKTNYLIRTLFDNKRKNKRLGVEIVDPKFSNLG